MILLYKKNSFISGKYHIRKYYYMNKKCKDTNNNRQIKIS